jgi:hypothetical protein
MRKDDRRMDIFTMARIYDDYYMSKFLVISEINNI